jgi:NAD+ synthase
MNLPEGLRFDDYELVRIQIVNFIKDYVKLAGVSKAVLGLSGGIDSSLVAALACEAIGPENVLGIMMPVDKEKDAKNIADAKLLAETLNMPSEIFELKKAVAVYDSLNLDKVARGNLAARLRMVTWYARANQENRLVLGTGNKTELMIGYFTKYGDGGSDVLPIGELYKVNVGISYDYLDSILFLHLEKGMSEKEIVEWGIDESKVMKVMKMKARTQHKRNPLPRPNLRLVTKH